MPPPFAEPVRPGRLKPHPQLDAVIDRHDVQRVDISRGLHYAFAEAEADRKILQILRRAHHHRIGAAVIGQRQRGFLGNGARVLAKAAVAPDLTINNVNRIVHGYSAASTAGAMRREWRACSS